MLKNKINIGIINFDVGNIKSIISILKKIPININLFLIKKNFKYFNKINKLIIPGQGSLFSCVKYIINFNFINFYKFILEKEILGICIGKHLFFEKSEEDFCKSINLLKGKISILNSKNNYKIPKIGWNKVFFVKEHPLLKNINNNYFYFSHSFYLNNNQKEYIYGISKYNIIYPVIFIKKNIILVQFHPEKSFKQGFKLFYNFCKI